jgi:hypothetical protein
MSSQYIMNQVTGSRHGKRADGVVVVSVPMPRALRAGIAEIAAKDNRKVAAWVRIQLTKLVRRSLAARAKVAA